MKKKGVDVAKAKKKILKKKSKSQAKPKKPAKPKAKPKIKAKTKAKTTVKTKAKAAPKAKAQSKPAAKAVNFSHVLTPLVDRILVEIVKSEKMTPGGLYIPDTAEVSGNFKAQVLAVGRGARDKKGRLRPLDVKVGDTVLVTEYAGTPAKVMERDLRILRESEVLGIIE